jgi:cytosine/adenosine deaminase-related metal-dependent hydrolase
MEFTDWIQAVVEYRRTRLADAGMEELKIAAIRRGIQQSLEAGVVAIGEIASAPILPRAYHSPLDVTLFCEYFGRGQKGQASLDAAQQTLELSRRPMPPESVPSSTLRWGLSPHAPYSVDLPLLEGLVRLASQSGCPLAIHLAESRAEMELLSSRSGPFVDLLQELGAWFPETHQSHTTIQDYLRALAHARNSLVVHGNYLTPGDVRLIAAHRDRIKIVYCPRTYHYFGPHAQPYPLKDFVNHGICLAVGTDSRASNPDLDLWAELKWIAGNHENIHSEAVLQMGTINGARALACDSQLGSLAVGKRAAINIVSGIECDSADDPGQRLFAPNTVCRPLDILSS